MKNSKYLGVLTISLCLALSACGGTTSPDEDHGSNSGGGNTGGGNTDNGNPPATNTAVKGLQLAAAKNSVAVGDKITVTAIGTDRTSAPNGQPDGERVSGAIVSFNAQSGQLSSDTATTDRNGVATVTFTAPDTSGLTTITATAQGVPSTFNVDIVAGPANVIRLSASPSTLGFNRSSTVSVQVQDSRDNPVSDQTVRLRAAMGEKTKKTTKTPQEVSKTSR